MDWKHRLNRFVSPFISAAIVLSLLIAVVYPSMLLQSKMQRQEQLRLSVEQIGRYLDQSNVRIVEALISMETIPRDCSPYVLQKFRYHHFWLTQVGEFSLYDPNGHLICSSWRHVSHFSEIPSHRETDVRLRLLASVADSSLLQPGLMIGRRARDGYENAAFIPLNSLKDTLQSFSQTNQFFALIDSKSGVPVVLEGQYSLPIGLDAPLFPLSHPYTGEGRGDTLKKQYWFIQPLVTFPELSLAVSVPTDVLYDGIYWPEWYWFVVILILQILLTFLFVFLKQKAADPKRHLLSAMRLRQFFNVYQPIIDARDGSLLGVEVLLRWQHPTAGLINPAEFIPMAESTGVIVPLTIQQMDEAERDLAPLLERYPKLYLSFNLCVQHLHSSAFINQLLQYKRHLPGLHVEITESELVEHNNPVVKSTLDSLCNHRIQIAIDDFGTGYSSLGYLQSMPVNTLKVDRSFVGTIGTEAVNAPVLEAIINLSQNLDIQVIAEGVETQAQAEWLVRHGVWRHQGWLYSKAEKAEALLRRQWPAPKKRVD